MKVLVVVLLPLLLGMTAAPFNQNQTQQRHPQEDLYFSGQIKGRRRKLFLFVLFQAIEEELHNDLFVLFL